MRRGLELSKEGCRLTGWQAIPQGDLTEEIKDLAYQSLMGPAQHAALYLPMPTPASELLPRTLQSKISTSMTAETATSLTTETVKKQDWQVVLEEIENGEGFKGMSTGDVNAFLGMVNAPKRAVLSTKILRMMEEAGIQPTTVTYDRLMSAHAERENPETVKALWRELNESMLS